MDKNLIKQAFKLGYQAGLEKFAQITPTQFTGAARALSRSRPSYMGGIKGHTYTPEQLEAIRKIQNSMVKAPVQRYEPSGPVETTTLT